MNDNKAGFHSINKSNYKKQSCPCKSDDNPLVDSKREFPS